MPFKKIHTFDRFGIDDIKVIGRNELCVAHVCIDGMKVTVEDDEY